MARPLEPEPPDYSKAAGWLCRPATPGQQAVRAEGGAALAPLPQSRLAVTPGRTMPGRAPSGLTHAEAPAVDCFWVHPTLEHGGATSNRLLPAASSRASFTLSQAAAFSGCAALWAPRYRQMVLGCDDFASVYRAAIGLAYSDVRAAFRSFLSQIGPERGFFLCGHSQGAGHVMALLRELFVGEGAEAVALRRRLVGAYPIGNNCPPPPPGQTMIPGLGVPVSTGPGQVGVLATWQTTTEDAELSDSLTARGASRHGIKEPLAVNPLSWRADDAECDASSCGSLGTWPRPKETVLYDGLIGATVCRHGLLRVLRTNEAYMKHYREPTTACSRSRRHLMSAPLLLRRDER